MQLLNPGPHTTWLATALVLLSGVAFAWMYGSYIGPRRTQQTERRIQWLAFVLVFVCGVGVWQVVLLHVPNSWLGTSSTASTLLMMVALAMCLSLQARLTPELWWRHASRNPGVRLIRWVGYAHCASVVLLQWTMLNHISLPKDAWSAAILAWQYTVVLVVLAVCCAMVLYLWVGRRQERYIEQVVNERAEQVVRTHFDGLGNQPGATAPKPQTGRRPWWWYAQFMGPPFTPYMPYMDELLPQEDED